MSVNNHAASASLLLRKLPTCHFLSFLSNQKAGAICWGLNKVDGTWVPGGHRGTEEEASLFLHEGQHSENSLPVQVAQLWECQVTGLTQGWHQQGDWGRTERPSWPCEVYLQSPRNNLQTLGCGRAEVFGLQVALQPVRLAIHSKQLPLLLRTFGLFRDYPTCRPHNFLVIAKQVGILRPRCLVPAAPGTQ